MFTWMIVSGAVLVVFVVLALVVSTTDDSDFWHLYADCYDTIMTFIIVMIVFAGISTISAIATVGILAVNGGFR